MSSPPAYPDAYPHDLSEVAFLQDGSPIEFRAILPADAARLERLFHRLSPQSRYRRFFAPIPRMRPDLLDYLVKVDYVNRLALVGVVGEEVVGVARYDRVGDSDEAEAAVIVEDAWQARGIGTRLLWRLSAAARQRGLGTFVAEVLAENRPMMGLLRVIAEDLDVQLQGASYTVRMRLAGIRARS